MKKRFKILFAFVALLAILASFCVGCASKTALASPTGFEVNDNYVLTWTEIVSAREYELRIRQLDGTDVSTQTQRRASVSLAFLEEGDYKIAVRAIGDGSKYTNSAWSVEIDFHKNYESGCIYELINNNSEYKITSGGTATGEVTIEEYYREKPVTEIGVSAFKQSFNLTKVTIGNKVEVIGGNAFSSCSNLEEVIIPQSVKEIGAAAFQSCPKITSIDLPDGIDTISDFTFAYCGGLASIDLSNVKTIGESAFSNCTGLNSIVVSDSVTNVGKNAFYRCLSVGSVTIGNGLEYLSDQMFADCESLTTVSFGNEGNLKELGTSCFNGCTSLEEITLPDGLEHVGAGAFYGCEKLKSATISESVTKISTQAFDGTKIYSDARANGDKFIYVGNWLVASTSDSLMTITRLSSENLKTGIVGIAAEVFFNRASQDNSSWSFDIPSSIKYIGSYAFSGTSVWRVVSSNGSRLKSIGQGAFYECTMLSNVILADGLEEIDAFAFYGCKLLNNSTQFSIIPDSVERVGAYAFRNTAMYFEPDSYGVVYAGLKGNESWVVDYVVSANENARVSSVELKSTIYGIADQAFGECADIRSIMGLNRASIIGSYAFYGCVGLAAVSLNPNLDTIKAGTFYGCQSLTDVSLPTRIKTIESQAFSSCINLTDVYNLNSNTLTSIGYAAFAYCYNLISDGTGESGITFGANLKELGEYAFYGCISLNNVSIPDGLKVISAHAFSHCHKLQNFDFGNGVEEIGDYAFYNVKEEVDTGGLDAEVWGEDPKGVIINLPDSVKKIGAYAFYGNGNDLYNGLGEFFGESTTNLGSVEEIGEFAFANCKLGSFVLPSTVKSIGRYAFYKSSMNSVTIGSGVENIARHAFNGCDGDITFYCETEGRPESWDARWNSSYIPVIWGCKLSDEGYVESVTVTASTISHGLNGIEAPVRIGYKFVGWSLTSGSQNIDYTAKEFINIPVGTTVYSVWNKTNNILED